MAGFREVELDAIEIREEEKARAMSALGYDGYDVHLSREGEVVAPTSTSVSSKTVSTVLYVATTWFVVWVLARLLPRRPATGELCRLVVLVCLALSCYALVQCSDPGYAKAKGFDVAPQEGDYEKRRERAAAEVAAIVSAREAQEVAFFSALLPWPDWPPMRCAYCRVAKRWIYTYDHFCPIVSTPIGEKNRGRFWLFLFAQTTALGYAAILAESAVTWAGVFDGSANKALITALILWLVFFAQAAFFVFHTFLALANLTTHEFLRADTIDYLYNTEDFDLPFSRGLCGNLRTFFLQDGLIAALFCSSAAAWRPVPWARAAFIDRTNADWRSHPWQNEYYSCC